MTDKTNFKARSTPRDKEGHFLMTIYQRIYYEEDNILHPPGRYNYSKSVCTTNIF